MPRRALVLAPAAGLLATLLPLSGVAAATRGSGRSATETRQLPDFQAIALGGAMDLDVRQGAVQSVQVVADDNLLPLLETVVEGGSNGPTLQVRWKKGQSIYNSGKVQVSVTVPKLLAVAVNGSGDVKIDAFTTPSLQLAMSGSGSARLSQLSTEELSVRIAGSGDVTGNGRATRLKVSIAGSGEVHLGELSADEVSIKIAGSGDAAVNAQKKLDVSIAGSGDVTYTGNAAVSMSTAGSGSVTKR